MVLSAIFWECGWNVKFKKSGENGNRTMKLEDIKKDAEKVRPYDHVYDMYYDEFADSPEELFL